jgi:hypothetical protein
MAVMRACEVLQPVDRDAFLRALAHRLRGEEIGDGTVGRAIRELLHGGFFRPPTGVPKATGLNKLATAPAIYASALR